MVKRAVLATGAESSLQFRGDGIEILFQLPKFRLRVRLIS
jgi:hypothetical protein